MQKNEGGLFRHLVKKAARLGSLCAEKLTLARPVKLEAQITQSWVVFGTAPSGQ